jgi:hypothetical protein
MSPALLCRITRASNACSGLQWRLTAALRRCARANARRTKSCDAVQHAVVVSDSLFCARTAAEIAFTGCYTWQEHAGLVLTRTYIDHAGTSEEHVRLIRTASQATASLAAQHAHTIASGKAFLSVSGAW